MAEFCPECWNRINETNDPPQKYVLSREPELCEGCGSYKAVIVSLRRNCLFREALGRWGLFSAGKRPSSRPAKTGGQREDTQK